MFRRLRSSSEEREREKKTVAEKRELPDEEKKICRKRRVFCFCNGLELRVTEKERTKNEQTKEKLADKKSSCGESVRFCVLLLRFTFPHCRKIEKPKKIGSV